MTSFTRIGASGPWLLGPEPLFPDPEATDDQGLLAVGGDLSPDRLLAAYRLGVFPWFSPGEPILWWCPPLRSCLAPSEVHVSRSLAKVLRQGRFEIRVDTAFADVIRACAKAPRPGQQGTWITPAMQRAYGELHRLGRAHSVEAWRGGRLVGGLYGVALGGAFFGESMFAKETDASKACFVALGERLAARGFSLLDCQVENPHTLSLGATAIPRAAFLARLEAALEGPDRWGERPETKGL